MKRTDIVMTEKLRSFLAFDLGHMDERLFPHRRADLRYSDDPDLLLDLYYPQEPRETYPVFLLVFGGGWVSGFRRSKYVEAMLAPLRFGYACAVAQYTLALDDVFPRPISDLKRAVHFLHTHARELQLDTSRLTLWGESAGGHLALETALLPDAALGLEGRIGWPGTSLGGIYSADSFHSFHQGLKSGGWRPRPAAVGRDAPQVGPKTRERGTTPAATGWGRAQFPHGMAIALRPGLESSSAQPSISGVDSIRRGKAPPLAGFRPFCPVKMDPSGARPPCQTGKYETVSCRGTISLSTFTQGMLWAWWRTKQGGSGLASSLLY